MKLIAEVTENIGVSITEDKETGKKNHFLEGVFMQADMTNKNGRRYPMETMRKEVQRYNENYIQKNRAYGELGHPDGPTINLERVSHLITSLKEDGTNIVGRAKVMDTPYGNIVKSLMDEGAQLGVSSRGVGTLQQQNGCQVVQDDFQLSTAADIVADPSAPQAFVNGVMENVNWVYDAASSSYRAMEVVEEVKKLGNNDLKALREQTLHVFERFLKTL